MADAGSGAVHTGFWLDHDREGRVRGATLTLTNQKAAALLAFLAIVVTFAANRSFKICRFCLHNFIHPSDTGTDSVAWAKRRRQVILRNSETAGGVLASLLETSISERSGSSASSRVTSKSVLLKLFITGHWLVFIALGILTSQIVIGRTVVSKKTSTCGKWVLNESQPQNESSDSQDEWQASLNEFSYNGTLDADNYVHNCYNDKSARGFFDCTKFVSRSLSFSEEHNVSCPFEHGFCMAGENSAFSMDTGNISFSALGINKKHSKDLSVRRRTTCAVVDQHPFYVGKKTSEDEPQVLAGNQTIVEYSFYTDESGDNVTIPFRSESLSSDYDLREWLFVGDSVTRALHPNSSTNDVSIMFLRGQGVEFFNTQDDPWFTAHVEIEWDNSTGIVPPGHTRYAMDHFLNVLVCDERAQLCNQVTGECSQWHGLLLKSDDLNSTYGNPLLGLKENMDGYNDMVYSILVVIQNIEMSHITHSIEGRGHAALQAIRYFNTGTQYRLDPEQWKVELRYWFKMALARVQLEIFNTIERPIDVDPARTKNLWTDKVTSAFCGYIKFRSANHTSLSTTGIVVILLGAAILTIVSFLDQLLASRFLRGRFQKFISAWEETENLALLQQITIESSNSNMTEDDNDGKVQVTIKEEQAGLIDNV